MKYTRDNPSEKYKELVTLYNRMHTEGDGGYGLSPDRTFKGHYLLKHVENIGKLIDKTNSVSVLDYGSGKGWQYEHDHVLFNGKKIKVQEYWDADIHCYDPCYLPFSKLPDQKFDGVISTDVMEHCPEEDVPWILDEIFSYAERFVFVNIACYKANKILPSGENAHCTIKPLEWWQEIIENTSRKYPEILWESLAQVPIHKGEELILEERKIGNIEY